MDFPLRTEIKIDIQKWNINYQTPSFFIGSCFSDNIGNILKKYKFPVLLNPFGVLYNPVSICNSLLTVINKSHVSEQDLIFQNNQWHSFLFHGSFSGSSLKDVVNNCNKAIEGANHFLKTCNFLFITFGTSWVYQFNHNGLIVSNCHKIPESKFTRFRLSVNDITSQWKTLIAELLQFNPSLKIVFTVSPVRHLKDGAHENQLSKATLLLAIDEIIKSFSPDATDYFPAYELINDELRDYRFYSDDMIHISDLGVNFIFEKFKKTYLNNPTLECLREVISIIQAKEHRILNEDPKSILIFSETMRKKTEKLSYIYPFINFQEELEHFKNLVCLK